MQVMQLISLQYYSTALMGMTQKEYFSVSGKCDNSMYKELSSRIGHGKQNCQNKAPIVSASCERLSPPQRSESIHWSMWSEQLGTRLLMVSSSSLTLAWPSYPRTTRIKLLSVMLWLITIASWPSYLYQLRWTVGPVVSACRTSAL